MARKFYNIKLENYDELMNNIIELNDDYLLKLDELVHSDSAKFHASIITLLDSVADIDKQFTTELLEKYIEVIKAERGARDGD